MLVSLCSYAIMHGQQNIKCGKEYILCLNQWMLKASQDSQLQIQKMNPGTLNMKHWHSFKHRDRILTCSSFFRASHDHQIKKHNVTSIQICCYCVHCSPLSTSAFNKAYYATFRYTVEPRFTNASHHEQIGSRISVLNKKHLGWLMVSRVTNTQAGNNGRRQAGSIGLRASVDV
jgi:hypothetical protein